jgi:hypothetical protein
MKTKKLLIGLTLAVFGMALISSTVLAGGKQRHRWEGVAIGVGAAILGHAIFQSHKADQSPQAVYAEPEPAPALPPSSPAPPRLLGVAGPLGATHLRKDLESRPLQPERPLDAGALDDGADHRWPLDQRTGMGG